MPEKKHIPDRYGFETPYRSPKSRNAEWADRINQLRYWGAASEGKVQPDILRMPRRG